jgi:2-polyprenyl-6-hydroxyphenyl methylase/3-demethylubiquinone-9 3-methyltransferase
VLAKILNIYKSSGIFTRLHIWVRYNTCPFLAIEEFVPREGLILDYGCGYGIFSHILSLLSPSRKICGFDIDGLKIKEAKKTIVAYGCNVFLSDKNGIENIIKTSDCITILDVLCYFSDRDRKDLLRYLYRTLKNGATLIIKDIEKKPSIKYIWLYLQELFALKLFNITQANLLNFFSADCLSKLLKDIGFKVQMIDISKNYFYPHILFACKKEY